MVSMRRPIFVRPLSDAERKALEDGLRSSDAFVLRRSQILLASSRGENAYRIARSLGCDSQTVRTAVKRFNEGGIEEALRKRSSRPKKIHAAFDEGRTERLREVLHRSPREFGKDTSLWTLALAAEVSFEKGITEKRVSAETVRATLERMGIRWLHAKRWITSPDPDYERKKGGATG
jgi:transposase